ncbi:MAG: trigger factor [Nanoarchaeota archaeon]|nr:trigger factor [Nanoarchaeota archaeon]
MSDYKNISVKKLEGSRIEITGEISAELVRSFEDKALQELGGGFVLSGFRRGHVPTKMVREKVGEVRVWIEAGEIALEREYPKIVESLGINVIGAPEVTITKLAPGNPLGFKITASVMPEVKLPDYKKIAKGVQKAASAVAFEVSDKEVEDLMLNLQKARVRHEKVIKDKSQHEGHEHGANNANVEDTLPLFDDEFAKSLGDFKDAEDFKKKAKENILEDKKLRAREKARFDLIDKIIEEMKTELPDVLVEGELHRMMAQFEGDVSRAGYSFQDYLKHAEKSEEDLKKEWKPQAEKRVKTQLALLEIAKKENLKPDKAKVEEGVKELLAQHKDPVKSLRDHGAGVDEKRVRAYVEEAFLNETALEYLENL